MNKRFDRLLLILGTVLLFAIPLLLRACERHVLGPPEPEAASVDSPAQAPDDPAP